MKKKKIKWTKTLKNINISIKFTIPYFLKSVIIRKEDLKI